MPRSKHRKSSKSQAHASTSEKPSRNKHDLCDMANWLFRIADNVVKSGVVSLGQDAQHLRKFGKRMKEIAQLV